MTSKRINPAGIDRAGSGSADGVWKHLRLIDHDGESAIAVRGGRIAWVGTATDLPAEYAADAHHDGNDCLVTPGLVDCHTHLVYGGNRADEFAQRLSGMSYEQVARSGGGIMATVRATREASEEQLFHSASMRLRHLMAEGVCTVEIKSGYGLALAHERKQLRVARRLASEHDICVRTTFLGAHALPSEYRGDSGRYIDTVCREMLPALAAENLVDAVDVYADRIAFSLAETERVFCAARDLGIPVKLHAGQFSDLGGPQLAARYGALSCDHLEHISVDGITAMREAGSVAVLLPVAYYLLRDTQPPPIAALRAAGVPMAIATDHNPGTAPGLSLLLAMTMACTTFGVTVAEAIAGVTRHAARALGLKDSHGHIAVGNPANFVLWDVRTEAELAYGLGQRPVHRIIRQGSVATCSDAR